MISAYCPGHITCVFAPVRSGGDPLLSGSVGVGIRISAGATVTVEETGGDSVGVTIDGKGSEASVTRLVLGAILPGRGLEVTVENDLPMSQGFGMSAAGAVAAGLCAAEIAGVGERAAWVAAHGSEIDGGGGLGDVSALYSLFDVPRRVRAGLPPAGEVVDTGLSFPRLTVAVFGGPRNTGRVLGGIGRAVADTGLEVLSEPMPDAGSLFALSNRFSAQAGMEGAEVGRALAALRGEGYRAAMCMIGNSIFSDCPADVMEGMFPHALVRETSSTCEKAAVRRSWRYVRGPSLCAHGPG